MSVFSIAICDDEHIACTQLLNMINTHERSHDFLVKTFFSGESLWKYIQDNKFTFDLILLDIRLNEMDGVDVGKLLRESEFGKQTEILYISSDCSYAMQLFDVRPINFLIKPVNGDVLLQNIDLAIERLQPRIYTFSYVNNKNIYSVRHSDIVYFESMSKTVIIHTVDGSNPSFYGSMEDVQRQLGYQHNFLQTHGSFLVNWEHVCQVFLDDIVMSNKDVVRVTRLYKKVLRNLPKKE